MIDREKPDFATDGRDWPNREVSRFVEAAGLTFHVQTMGEGPDIVLLHGTGASTHSFRAMMPLLASDHRVTAFDLPGHGFTQTPAFTRLTLPSIASACGGLLDALELRPVALVGHSAGAAVALRMAMDGLVLPAAIVGFNASLNPFAGAVQPLFSGLAKLLFVNPLTPRFFAATASERRVRKLLGDTGSKLDDEMVSLYRTLFRKAGHVSGALGMMAGWDLSPLQRDLPKLTADLTLVAASLDKMVPPATAARSVAKVPSGRVVRMAGLGHLAHEEDPPAAAKIVREAIARAGAPVSAPGSG